MGCCGDSAASAIGIANMIASPKPITLFNQRIEFLICTPNPVVHRNSEQPSESGFARILESSP
jgi:hypothetical protein